jgi:hypothetical protein
MVAYLLVVTAKAAGTGRRGLPGNGRVEPPAPPSPRAHR